MQLQSTLAKRLFFGSIMLAMLIGLIITEGWLSACWVKSPLSGYAGLGFSLVLAAILMVAVLELTRLAKSKDVNIATPTAVLLVVLVVTQPFWSPWIMSYGQDRWNVSALMAFIFVIGLFTASWRQARHIGISNTLLNIGFTCFLLVYLGLGGWFLVKIRILGLGGASIGRQIGPVIMFLVCVKSADIGAYFTGRACGKHLWVPKISPAKTWEGFVGGILLAVIVASLFAILFDIISLSTAILFGLVVAVVGQLGDLLESMIKRDVGVKDSSRLIPAFGGVLDLIDSVIVAAPFGYLILHWTLQNPVNTF